MEVKRQNVQIFNEGLTKKLDKITSNNAPLFTLK